jgi:hypothetical protein
MVFIAPPLSPEIDEECVAMIAPPFATCKQAIGAHTSATNPKRALQTPAARGYLAREDFFLFSAR